jgi:hypothetical protein
MSQEYEQPSAFTESGSIPLDIINLKKEKREKRARNILNNSGARSIESSKSPSTTIITLTFKEEDQPVKKAYTKHILRSKSVESLRVNNDEVNMTGDSEDVDKSTSRFRRCQELTLYKKTLIGEIRENRKKSNFRKKLVGYKTKKNKLNLVRNLEDQITTDLEHSVTRIVRNYRQQNPAINSGFFSRRLNNILNRLERKPVHKLK